jgi:hypothetical protein
MDDHNSINNHNVLANHKNLRLGEEDEDKIKELSIMMKKILETLNLLNN